MSLILEALKKSEAKRRLGEAPDLGTPFSAPRRRSKVLPIAAALIVAAVIWWVVHTAAPAPPTPKGDSTAQASASKPVSPVSTPASTPGQKSGTPLRAVTGANDLQEAPAPANLPKAAPARAGESFVAAGPTNGNPMANGAPRRSPEEIRDRRRANPENGSRLPPYAGMGRAPQTRPLAGAPSTTTSARPVAAAPSPAVPASKPVATPSAPVAAVTPQPQRAGAPVVAPSVPVTAAPVVAPSAPATAGTVSAPVATRAPKTPGTIGLPDTTAAPAPSKPAAQSASAQPYSELPFSVRKSLPELRLSMHVYMPDPAQRFVILNDSRITEGEKTTDDVNVREIRPDGVVLEFQGQRFFYPRDGL